MTSQPDILVASPGSCVQSGSYGQKYSCFGWGFLAHVLGDKDSSHFYFFNVFLREILFLRF